MAATSLLDENGQASIATAMMMSHHAFRRDLQNFSRALSEGFGNLDDERHEALCEEWTYFRGALHGHHEIEDTQMFPAFAQKDASLVAVIRDLAKDHRIIDPLLDRGDEAFAAELDVSVARETVAELARLLDGHLAREEATVVPLLREVRDFPTPETDDHLDMYADGFAWSSHGIAPRVLEQVYAMLPEGLTARLPAARARFEQRCERVWGTAAAGSSHTSIPE